MTPWQSPPIRREPAVRAARHRRGEGARLRADILAAATDLLDHADERAVTLRAVARRAGIAAPSIYPHFPGRDAILRAVAREAVAELMGRLGAAVAAETDPEQRLYAACDAYVDFACAHPQRYRAVFGELGAPGVCGSGTPAVTGSGTNVICGSTAPAATGSGTPVVSGSGTPAVTGSGTPARDAVTPAAGTLETLAGTLTDCVAAGRSTSTDPFADAVALWAGLHGLAHQLVLVHAFPWPADVVRRVVAPLAHITPRPHTAPVRHAPA